MLYNKRFNEFITENSGNPSFLIGTYNIEDALNLSNLLIRNGYNYIDDFNDDLLKLYFDTYNISDDLEDGIFTFVLYPDKKMVFRIYSNSRYNHMIKSADIYIYPNDSNRIRRKIILSPQYRPYQFVREDKNNMEDAREIAVKVETEEEYNKLKDFIDNFDEEYSSAFTSVDFNIIRAPYYIYFCFDKERKHETPGLVTHHNIGNNGRDIEILLNDIESADQFTGVYKKVYTMDDFEDVKRILTNRKILPNRPNYNPKKFIFENKKVNSFKDFMLDNVFESKKGLEVPFVISQRLQGLLSSIKHPIAERLIYESGDLYKTTSKATLIDYDEDEKDKFTYTLPNKFIDALEDLTGMYYPTPNQEGLYSIMKTNKELYEVSRTSIKIGRLINKLYPNEYVPTGENSIEGFVNAIKLERNRRFDNFEIVNGRDIIKYYNEESYNKEAFNGSELGNSCMRYENCADYIYFYEMNEDVSLLILKSDDEKDKIVARALLWNISECNYSGVTSKFMDRVYFTKNYQKELFFEHAQNNKWFYKRFQSDASNKLWNPKTGEFEECLIKTKSTFKVNPTDEYPYMDTMKWFYVNKGFLANTLKFREDDDVIYFMQETGGGYHIEGKGKYVEYYDDYIEEEDLIYCELGNGYRLEEDSIYLEDEEVFATEEYANINCTYTRDGRWILNSKAIEYIDYNGMSQFTTQEYAIDNYTYSEKDGVFYENGYFSEFYEDGISASDAIRVYTDDDILTKGTSNNWDYLLDDGENYFLYFYGQKVYPFMNNLKDKFVEAITSLSKPDITRYYHKEVDKDDYEEYNGKYYMKELIPMIKRKKGSD